MKIVYYRCHETLGFNEVTMLRELGHQVRVACSNGGKEVLYYNSSNLIAGNMRPDVEFDYFELEEADACIWCYHHHQMVDSIKRYARGKKLFWRFIGQSNSNWEANFARLKEEHGLKFIRYSPTESLMGNYAGQDALIRFGIDPLEYNGYTGKIPRIAISCNHMMRRENVCSSTKMLDIVEKKEHIIFGLNNDFSEFCVKPSYDDFRRELSNSRLFLTAGTIPASYTLGFAESLMTGIPVVVYDNGYPLNEMRSIITHGVNGFISNNVKELREICDELLNDIEYAKEIGEKGRETAIKLFSIDNIKEQWRQFLSK